jgi:hypothetical protein
MLVISSPFHEVYAIPQSPLSGNEHRSRLKTSGRETDHFHTVIAPPNVCAPELSAWIEQERFFFSLRIDGVGSGSLGTVTQRAGQPKILLNRSSTRSERNDLFDMHWHARDALGVLSEMAGRGKRNYPPCRAPPTAGGVRRSGKRARFPPNTAVVPGNPPSPHLPLFEELSLVPMV